MSHHGSPETGWPVIRQTIRRTWSDPRRWLGVLLAAAPGLVFVAVNVGASLIVAIAAAIATAVAGVGIRLARRESPTSALVGVAVVALCAAVAALTGQARGFFLVPALVPVAVILICLGSVVARRPLTGLILNRVTGGPPDWYRHPGLRRVHMVATSAAIAINIVNTAVQAIFYGRGDTAVLAVAHAATAPAFATLVAVTIVAVRTTLARHR